MYILSAELHFSLKHWPIFVMNIINFVEHSVFFNFRNDIPNFMKSTMCISRGGYGCCSFVTPVGVGAPCKDSMFKCGACQKEWSTYMIHCCLYFLNVSSKKCNVMAAANIRLQRRDVMFHICVMYVH